MTTLSLVRNIAFNTPFVSERTLAGTTAASAAGPAPKADAAWTVAVSRGAGTPAGAERILRAAGVDPGARGESLTVQDYAAVVAARQRLR